MFFGATINMPATATAAVRLNNVLCFLWGGSLFLKKHILAFGYPNLNSLLVCLGMAGCRIRDGCPLAVHGDSPDGKCKNLRFTMTGESSPGCRGGTVLRWGGLMGRVFPPGGCNNINKKGKIMLP